MQYEELSTTEGQEAGGPALFIYLPCVTLELDEGLELETCLLKLISAQRAMKG